MEILFLFIGLVLGGLLAAVIYSFRLKGSYISRQLYDQTNETLRQSESQLQIAEERLLQYQQRTGEVKEELQQEKQLFQALQQDYYQMQQRLSREEAGNAAYAEQKEALQQERNGLLLQAEALQKELRVVGAQKTEAEGRNMMVLDKLNTQKAEMESLHQKARLEFEKLASEILDDRARKFTEVNKVNLDAIIKPLGENIEGFKRTIRETHLQESKDRASLETKVKELILQTNKISDEANNLATALKGQIKKQGNWGEMILESILEQSGLVKNREYFLQQTIKDPSGRLLRPDVLIRLPDNRTIIVDSKVSMRAYDRYVGSATPEEQQLHLKDHLRAMNQHIQELHEKNYDQIEASLDFTMLFVPIEPAYLLSIQQDPELWANAYQKRILLISPTNLIACLKLMDDLWKREKQSQHALEIVRKGEQMYEKLVGFVGSMEAVGENLQRSQRFYEKAINQLKDGKGNLIDQALKLKAMGLKSSKQFSAAMMPTDMDVLTQAEQEMPAANSIDTETAPGAVLYGQAIAEQPTEPEDSETTVS